MVSGPASDSLLLPLLAAAVANRVGSPRCEDEHAAIHGCPRSLWRGWALLVQTLVVRLPC